MGSSALAALEREIGRLPLDEQVQLLERMARRLRRAIQPGRAQRESQLALMASDPAIRRELDAIDDEFAGTEADGLGDA